MLGFEYDLRYLHGAHLHASVLAEPNWVKVTCWIHACFYQVNCIWYPGQMPCKNMPALKGKCACD